MFIPLDDLEGVDARGKDRSVCYKVELLDARSVEAAYGVRESTPRATASGGRQECGGGITAPHPERP